MLVGGSLGLPIVQLSRDVEQGASSEQAAVIVQSRLIGQRHRQVA
jgi:hypothetical protein